jgi:hypothetical protein
MGTIIGWAIVIIVGFLLLLALLFVGIIWALSEFMRPNTTAESVNKIKSFLGFYFNDDYQVIEHNSQNHHPDRPLHIKILVSEGVLNDIKAHIDTLETGSNENFNSDKSIVYSESITRTESGFKIGHSAAHINKDGNKYTFFSAWLDLDFEKSLLVYGETHY